MVVAFSAWFLWPITLGGSTSFVIISGKSMEPLYAPGDLVVARKGVPAIGDVVVYRPEGLGDAKVVHQIVGGDGVAGWDVKGVNNTWVDEWHPTNRDVVGVVAVHFGAGNHIGAVILSPIFWGAFLVAAIGLLLWPERRNGVATRERDAPVTPPADSKARKVSAKSGKPA